MIDWNRASLIPVPKNYECLLLLEDHSIVYQKAESNMPIVAWARINRPDWMSMKDSFSGESND